MKKYILTVIALAHIIGVSAQSFRAEGLEFEILDSDSHICRVTYSESLSYTGDIMVPSVVENDGVEYTVTEIGPYAFAGCDGIFSVMLPETVSTIGRNAFQGCSSISEIEFPAAVSMVNDQCFYGCRSLQSFKGEGVTAIGVSSFSGCGSLENMVFGGLITIGNGAFANCSSIQEVDLSAGAELGEGVFSGCSSLYAVTLPTGISRVPSYSFNGCVSLKEILNGENVEEIGEYAFHTCSSLHEFPFKGRLTAVGTGAFGFCSSLQFESLNGTGIIIGDFAFRGCESIESVELAGVVEIGIEAFANANSMTSLSFDSEMHNIRERAFLGCPAIVNIKSGADIPPFMANNSFMQEVFDNAVLTVPESRGLIYAQTPPWSNFWDIRETEESGLGCIEIEAQKFRASACDGMLVINGEAGFVEVYSIEGTKIFSGMKGLGVMETSVNRKGVFIVCLNGRSLKVLSR